MRCTPMRETVLYVDLDRLAENTRQVRKWIGPNVTFLAVVKGDGYGHGAPEIAPTLLKNGADMLGVGYGYTWTARRTTVLGTLPFGFADGFSAQLAGIGTVMIRGKNVPLVGKICMDQCMVDLTDLPEAAVGDEVLIFGDGSHGENTVAGLCEKMGVTRGEVLCRITQRVPRVYLKQGSAAACRDLTAK